MENIVYFALAIGYQVDVSHNRDLEGLLVIMCYDNKHEIIIRVETPLIEKRGSIENGQIGASLDISNYL